MVTASIACNDLNIHTLILRGLQAAPFQRGMYTNDLVWAFHHSHFNWSFSAKNCNDLQRFMLTLLVDLGVDYYEGFDNWQEECMSCSGEECSIQLDINDVEMD